MSLSVHPSNSVQKAELDAMKLSLPQPRNWAEAIFWPKLRGRIGMWASRWPDVVRMDPCVYCFAIGSHVRRTIEHILPQSLGGRRLVGNIAGACGVCQVARSNHPFLWAMLQVKFRKHRYDVWSRLANGKKG